MIVKQLAESRRSIPYEPKESIFGKRATKVFDSVFIFFAKTLSTSLYMIVYHVLRYRYNVIKKNLSHSFPYKDEKAIAKLIREYYKHLADLVVELPLFMVVSSAKRRSLATYKNLDLLGEYFRENKHIVAFASHYGNWEYLINLPNLVNFEVFTAYTPISNKRLDDWVFRMRSFFGVTLIAKQHFYRGALSALRRPENPSLVVVIADQRPPRGSSKYFVEFLNQNTNAQIGAERLAMSSGAAIAYLDCKKTSRFHYEFTFRLITDQPALTKPMTITTSYYNMLKGSIERSPAHWLWSHNRWKTMMEPEVAEK